MRLHTNNAPRRHLWVAGALLLAAAALRIAGAWCYRDDTNPDYGIVALMVRHMLAGRGIPVFFYGQPYMGTLEPLASAALARLVGFSGFAVCLGTALIGLAVLPVTYRWARGLHGPRAALAALLFVAVGPPEFFRYLVSPRGGYAVAVLAGTLVLAGTGELLRAPPLRRAAAVALCLVLGIVGGLGWWTSQLTTAALLASGIAWLIGNRWPWRDRLPAGAAAGAGFLIGAAPFWIWNLLHRWESFTYAASLGRGNAGRGLALFFGRRLAQLLGAQERITWPVAAAGALLAACFALYVGLAATRLRHAPREWHTRAPEWLPVCFVACSAALFAPSFFATLNTGRYLVPLVPALAVMVGATTDWLCRRLPAGLGWLPVALLAAHQATALPDCLRREVRNAAFAQRARELAEVLRTHDVQCVYAPFAFHGLNHLLNEAFTFSEGPRERYRPYAAALEEDPLPAVLGNHAGFREFCAGIGLRYATANAGPLGLCLRAQRAPDGGRREIAPDALRVTRNRDPAPLRTLTDDNLDTVLPAPTGTTITTLHIVLDTPRRLVGLRFICRASAYPDQLGVDTFAALDGPGLRVPGSSKPTDYFWSGERFYLGGSAYRCERWFAPREVIAIDIQLAGAAMELAEIQVFEEDAAVPPDEGDAVEALARQLLAGPLAGGGTLYADRWAANRLHALSDGAIRTPRDPAIYPHDRQRPPGAIRGGAPALLLVRREDAGFSARALLAEGAGVAREDIGPWALIRADVPNAARLVWVGPGCLRGGAASAMMP